MFSNCFFSWVRSRALIVFGALLLMGNSARAEEVGEFSPWMSLSEMNAYFEALDGDKPEGKNFWDRGNWITALEGRWEAGIPQYRLSHSPVPAARRGYWWFWHHNLDQKTFDARVHELADDGFTLVSFNSFVRPGGSERFQGVWHKLTPLTGAALLPAGRYRLVEMEGKPVVDFPVNLTIAGDRLSGITGSNEFTGSVRDRTTGAITATKFVESGGNNSPKQAVLERSFLKLLEYASWKEEGGKLRVVKNGQTVLRLDRDEPPLEAAKPAR